MSQNATYLCLFFSVSLLTPLSFDFLIYKRSLITDHISENVKNYLSLFNLLQRTVPSPITVSFLLSFSNKQQIVFIFHTCYPFHHPVPMFIWFTQSIPLFLLIPFFFVCFHHTNSYLSCDTQVMYVRWDSSLSPQVGVGTLFICCHRL